MLRNECIDVKCDMGGRTHERTNEHSQTTYRCQSVPLPCRICMHSNPIDTIHSQRRTGRSHDGEGIGVESLIHSFIHCRACMAHRMDWRRISNRKGSFRRCDGIDRKFFRVRFYQSTFLDLTMHVGVSELYLWS